MGISDKRLETYAAYAGPPPIPARLFYRCVAFTLDVVLIGAFVLMLLQTYLIPTHIPNAEKEFLEFIETFQQYQEEGKELSYTDVSPTINKLMGYMFGTFIISYWLYFMMTEWLMRGSSLGKKVFSLRVVSHKPNAPPPSFLESIIRSGIKTLSLLACMVLPSIFALNPLAFLAANYFIVFFNTHRKAGHDYICRTYVVGPTHLSLLEEIT